MYKKASKLRLRIDTPVGMLSIEQVWNLSMNQLASIIRSLKEEIDATSSDDELSFLGEEENKIDEITQLRFDIVKDIYLDRKAEIAAAKDEAETKANNQKILEIIKRKQDSALEDKSIEELEALLK